MWVHGYWVLNIVLKYSLTTLYLGFEKLTQERYS